MLSVSERAPIYSWLSLLLVREIDEATWATLQMPALASILGKIEPELVAWTRGPWNEALREDLASEYARLFLLPKGVPPFASAWIDGNREQLGATLSALVARTCEVLGRNPVRAEPWGKLPLDHVALLFDLVSAAARSDDTLDLEVAAHLDREALGDWLVPFGRTLRTQASSPLYRAIGGLIESLHEE